VEDARFWALIALLGGIADDTSVLPLDLELRRTGETEAFHDVLEARVSALLADRELPWTHGGDGGEWLAAAVVAAGEVAYERTLASSDGLDPGAWAWEEAEALLVAGMEHDQADEEVDELLWLQWCTHELPPGVSSTWEEWHDALAGGDPTWGRSVIEDPDWDAAVRQLQVLPAYVATRARLGGLVLSIELREDVEAEVAPWSVDEEYDVTHVVLTFPAAELRALPSRTQTYVEMVPGLAESAVSHLDL
jgi:hypothetical protein